MKRREVERTAIRFDLAAQCIMNKYLYADFGPACKNVTVITGQSLSPSSGCGDRDYLDVIETQHFVVSQAE